MSDEALSFENPWDPSKDLFYKCYNRDEWESRACVALVVVSQEDTLYQIVNFFGDVRGLYALCGIVEKVILPVVVSTSTTSTGEGPTTPAGHLAEILAPKLSQMDRLEDMFYEDIYPDEWSHHGVLERAAGIQKWVWKPLLLACMKKSVSHGKGGNATSLSSAVVMNGYGFSQLSGLVSVIRSLLSTILEDDLSSQTLVWFESHASYWKLWLEWLQSFYDDLLQWQTLYDKRGVWNAPHGKLNRIIRPFSTFFPSVSLFFHEKTLDKSGVIRMLLYQTRILHRWIRILTRALSRVPSFTSVSRTLKNSAVAHHEFIDVWIEHLTPAGITNLGYSQSLVWNDVFLEYNPLPPFMALWTNLQNPRKLAFLKNFISTSIYQQLLWLDLLETTYTHNELFRPMIREFRAATTVLYKDVQTLEFIEESV